MQPNATIEKMLDLSACYLGLRHCGTGSAAGVTQKNMDATSEQGGSSDPAPYVRH